ncbi:MAG TPA: dienelactone hydrolase family protein [Terriglobia bacterium]|nr:dienelactone hydrolase family protein [Terriglobia bacterium]
MNRRKFLRRSAQASLTLGLGTQFTNDLQAGGGATATATPPSILPGTMPLTASADLAMEMVETIKKSLLRKTGEAAQERSRLWNRDYQSVEAYNHSVSGNRDHLRHIIGAVDSRVEPTAPQLVCTIDASAQVSQGEGYKVYAMRWAVLGPIIADYGGLSAEGLLLQPDQTPAARIVAIPDADWLPEMLAGMSPGVPEQSQFARRLAENGCQVLIPVIIDRSDTFSGIPGISFTNEPHREWIYRMAFEVGRHIIGYEVQQVLAAIDWFALENNRQRAPIGVMGYGEGGLLALYSAALDQRIDATVVSGYFQGRDGLWQEPIYRDVWGFVREFGDAELASLVAPRSLTIEASRGPEVAGPPPVTGVHKEGACPNGKLISPPLDSVEREVERARPFFASLKAADQLRLIVSENGAGPAGSDAALQAFLNGLGVKSAQIRPSGTPPADRRSNFDPNARLHSQLDQLVGYTQALIRKSPNRRKEFWSKVNVAWPDEQKRVTKDSYEPPSGSGSSQWFSSPMRWREATKSYRDYIWEEVIGRLPSPSLPANPRTRLIYDEPEFAGYEVQLDVWPDVFAYGILLVPKGIEAGERRPVVVCQHGLEGRAQDVADPKIDSHFYHHFAATLAKEGFVTYAPQNPHIGNDRFRIIQRMGHPLKLALFSFIIGQHEQTVNWLATLPFVDPDRIGFYGLSYGGKTAVRVPPFVDRYALSICAGDFNEWVWKTTNVESHYSYLLWGEYDMYEFNFANVVNYAELASLIAPRPFMVERGHYDPVAPDDEVAYEYALLRWFYAYMGIPDRTAIEFFNGPHTIHGVGTFEFLRKHLRWPN